MGDHSFAPNVATKIHTQHADDHKITGTTSSPKIHKKSPSSTLVSLLPDVLHSFNTDKSDEAAINTSMIIHDEPTRSESVKIAGREDMVAGVDHPSTITDKLRELLLNATRPDEDQNADGEDAQKTWSNTSTSTSTSTSMTRSFSSTHFEESRNSNKLGLVE